MEIKTKKDYQDLIKQFGRRKAYELYIASSAWKAKREERLKMDRYECVACPETENLHVHHKYPSAYENVPNEDVNYDLKTYCEACHMALHNSINQRRYQDRDIEIQNYQLPREAERELTSYGLESSELQIDWCMPGNPAQWRISQPDEPDCPENENDFWQTEKDGRRFRGIG